MPALGKPIGSAHAHPHPPSMTRSKETRHDGPGETERKNGLYDIYIPRHGLISVQ